VTLRAIFPNPGQVLLPGMFARVILEEGIDDTAILISQHVVMRDVHGSASVYVVNDQNIVELRQITVGRTHNSYWIVTDGLSKGDMVVLEGLQFIHPGLKVLIKNQNEEDKG
jgi:membrane fusion protein (multidrug efflux system)